MTGQERIDLTTAIGLIHDLREEMNQGFVGLRSDIAAIQSSYAEHVGMHAERDRAADKVTISRRFLLGFLVTGIVSLGTLLKEIFFS